MKRAGCQPPTPSRAAKKHAMSPCTRAAPQPRAGPGPHTGTARHRQHGSAVSTRWLPAVAAFIGVLPAPAATQNVVRAPACFFEHINHTGRSFCTSAGAVQMPFGFDHTARRWPKSTAPPPWARQPGCVSSSTPRRATATGPVWSSAKARSAAPCAMPSTSMPRWKASGTRPCAAPTRCASAPCWP